MTDEVDRKLASLLALPEGEPDEMFVVRVRQAVMAEERLLAVRIRAQKKLLADAAAGGAIALAFLILGRLQPPGPEGMEVPFFSPAMIALVLLGVWTLVTLRPAPNGRT